MKTYHDKNSIRPQLHKVSLEWMSNNVLKNPRIIINSEKHIKTLKGSSGTKPKREKRNKNKSGKFVILGQNNRRKRYSFM